MSGFGLVLGGGGARGLAHIGVWQVLEEAGLRPHVLAGTSMGGLVAALIAAGTSGEELRRIAETVSWRRLLDWRPGAGLLRTSAFEAWLAEHLPPTFEQLQWPLAVTATDVLTGRLVYLSRGNLYAALRATSAYPGAIAPVALDDMLLADGGILNQVPVDAAFFLGAQKVVAVDATFPEPLALPERRRWRGEGHLGALQALRRAVDIMQAQLTEARLSLYRPDVLLRPQLAGVELQSFWRRAQAIRAGEAAARAQLPQLRALLS
ncbi:MULTISPECIES: patatin-like phospholipase family protein [Deinococcus]|uniref:Alpha-beta hydrolase superfamily n=1 Tax=Deinococcus geothermalis (strain DSM 11300 / CIP 105573 / AG-3a) TaxID=319795 RepID=Q1IZF8_DEIGD|nr:MULTISPECIES: patatin-like phospholipase family protein [Deinococcus]ABF45376.1 alpha-beta hydrolase superfamily [Deinococcus geothermalis DSM 11300]MBI0444652.1 patatin [Deinococcus sp. DB0503]TDE86639.1 patatin [Deinococcus sp. S9]